MSEETETEIEPIPVRIVGEEEEKAADFGTWIGFSLVGTEPAFQIMPQDRKRKRAVVVVNGAAPGFVYIGNTMQQVQGNQGGQLFGGNTVAFESQSAMWVKPNGANPMIVSVLLEGYRAQ